MSVDVVTLDERAGARVAALIVSADPASWDAPTPCAGWTVADLVEHLIAGNVKYAGIASGDDYTPGAPHVDIGDDPAATYRTTLDQMLHAWRRPGAMDRAIALPRDRRGPAEVAAWIHLAEPLGHGWDLATATGQEPGFDDDVVQASFEECQRRM